MDFDPISTDIATDTEFPAFSSLVTFSSGGKQLIGRVFAAQGKEPNPTVLLLHGFPGTEQNFDLAHVFRRLGWNAFLFHYRGAWGCEGDYSFGNVLEDVAAAVDFITSEEASVKFRVDTKRIALIGHSLGGFAALMVTAANPSIVGAASLAGFNVGAFFESLAGNSAALEAVAGAWDEEVIPLRGTSGAALAQECTQQGQRWNLLNHAEALRGRSVCLISGTRDGVAPVSMHHDPLVEALSGSRLQHHVLDADHGFSDKRIALARLLVDWLRAL